MSTGILTAGVLEQTVDGRKILTGFPTLLRVSETKECLEGEKVASTGDSEPVAEWIRQNLCQPSPSTPNRFFAVLRRTDGLELKVTVGPSFTGAFALLLLQHCAEKGYLRPGLSPEWMFDILPAIPLDRVAVCAEFVAGELKWPGGMSGKLNALDAREECRLCIVGPPPGGTILGHYSLPLVDAATLKDAVGKLSLHFAECAVAG